MKTTMKSKRASWYMFLAVLAVLSLALFSVFAFSSHATHAAGLNTSCANSHTLSQSSSTFSDGKKLTVLIIACYNGPTVNVFARATVTAPRNGSVSSGEGYVTLLDDSNCGFSCAGTDNIDFRYGSNGSIGYPVTTDTPQLTVGVGDTVEADASLSLWRVRGPFNNPDVVVQTTVPELEQPAGGLGK
jgi:hypothetical protein